jgi:hypothetical protein
MSFVGPRGRGTVNGEQGTAVGVVGIHLSKRSPPGAPTGLRNLAKGCPSVGLPWNRNRGASNPEGVPAIIADKTPSPNHFRQNFPEPLQVGGEGDGYSDAAI